MKRFTAITHISICLVCIMATLLLLAIATGLIPNPYKQALKSRAVLCENLAIQLCSTKEKDLSGVFGILAPALVERNEDILSMGFRNEKGRLLAHTEGHPSFWEQPSDKHNTTHIQLPLFQEDRQLATIEICFKPIVPKGIYGFARSASLPLVVFMVIPAFVIFRFYLKRVLRHLDPSSVIPARVKAVLDNLSESVVVIDNNEQIVFANEAFARVTQQLESELLGRKLSVLPWMQPKTKDQASVLPWLKSIQDGTANVNIPLLLKNNTGQMRHSLVNAAPILGSDGQYKGIMTSFTDVTEIEQKNQELIEMSRTAGMAEVATNVLHNVGNILNSVNVSTSYITSKLSDSKLSRLSEMAKMIADHKDDLAAFLTQDERGKYIPSYLIKLTDILLIDQSDILEKVQTLQSNVEYLKETIRMQQSYAVAQDCETLTSVKSIIDDAIQMNHDILQNGGIEVIKEYDETDYIEIDKPQVLQILINLIRNAAEAFAAGDNANKTIKIKCIKSDDSGYLHVRITDNGVGISSDILTKIFRHGFTTKQKGHGFGLHSCAVSAKKMNGSLHAQSEGEGKGATFILKLPLKPKRQNHGKELTCKSSHTHH